MNKSNCILIVDFETTGLIKGDTQDPKRQPGIVQIGMVMVDENWDWLEDYQTLVNPEMPIEPEAQSTHGIDAAKVKDAPTMGEVVSDLIHWFLGVRYWGGHNCEFDRQVLWYQALRYNFASRFPWPAVDVDTMVSSKDHLNLPGKRGVKMPRLEELHNHLFGHGFAGAHDALQDVLATMRCGSEMKKRGWL